MVGNVIFRTDSSNLLLGSLWNFLQCCLILYLNYQATFESDGVVFFNLQVCSWVYVANVIACFIYFKVACVKEESVRLSTKCGVFLPVGAHTISVLFGAPYINNWDSTLSFSMLLTSLMLPTIATGTSLSGRDTQFSRLKWVQLNELCALGGAWISAVVVPLDWDRPWQVWPVPCCIGATVGCTISSSYRIIVAAYQLYWPSIFLYINSVSEIKKQ